MYALYAQNYENSVLEVVPARSTDLQSATAHVIQGTDLFANEIGSSKLCGFADHQRCQVSEGRQTSHIALWRKRNVRGLSS